MKIFKDRNSYSKTGYGSEQNYDDVLNVRKRVPLITYNQYRKEKKKKFKNDPLIHLKQPTGIDDITDSFICPNNRKLYFAYQSIRKDKYGFKRTFNVYECDDCADCPLRSLCTNAAEGKTESCFIIKNGNLKKNI